MGSGLNLGRLFGIEFRLHYTWFIVFVLVVVSLSAWRFPMEYPGWNPVIYWIVGVITSLLVFASVVAHELAHSLVGKANGIPIKSITLFIFGGIAQMTKEATRPGAEFKMAFAGPACSLVIGGLFALLWWFIQDTTQPLAAMALSLAEVNGLLAVFNMIPGFPLDGGRVFRSILWRFTGSYNRSTRIATQTGRIVGYLFILGGILMFILQDWDFGGLWLAFIGWFLESAASASYRQVQRREGLSGFTAMQVMTSDFPVVSSNVTFEELVQGYIFTSGRHFFVVADEGNLKGILTLRDIKSVPQQSWGATRVKDVMTPVDKLKVAYPEQEAIGILEQMGESDINQMPVVTGGRVIGLITRDNLIRFLRVRSELGK